MDFSSGELVLMPYESQALMQANALREAQKHKGQGSRNARSKKRSRAVPETGDRNAELQVHRMREGRPPLLL